MKLNIIKIPFQALCHLSNSDSISIFLTSEVKVNSSSNRSLQIYYFFSLNIFLHTMARQAETYQLKYFLSIVVINVYDTRMYIKQRIEFQIFDRCKE